MRTTKTRIRLLGRAGWFESSLGAHVSSLFMLRSFGPVEDSVYSLCIRRLHYNVLILNYCGWGFDVISGSLGECTMYTLIMEIALTWQYLFCFVFNGLLLKERICSFWEQILFFNFSPHLFETFMFSVNSNFNSAVSDTASDDLWQLTSQKGILG